MKPVECANALGGVEIGRVIAIDADIATPTSSALTPPTSAKLSPMPVPTAQSIGTNRAAVAVLLMKLESVQQIRPEPINTAIGDHEPKGIALTRSVAKPDLLNPKPRAKPPATIQSTLQLICSKSFLLRIPVRQSSVMGISAAALASTPLKCPVNQTITVSTKVPATTHVL